MLEEMCDKAVDSFPFVFDSILDQYMVQAMCDKVVSKESFMLTYYPNECKTQECVIKIFIC